MFQVTHKKGSCQMANKQEKSVKSFAELGDVFKDLRLEIPKIDAEALKDPSRRNEVVKKKLESCREIKKNVAAVLKWFDDVEVWLVEQREDVKDPLERRIAEDEIKADKANAEQYISDCLEAKETIFRVVAAQTIFKHFFEKQVESVQERDEIANQLQKHVLLVEDKNGTIRIGYKVFSISDKLGFNDEDRQEVERCYRDFNESLERVEKERRRTNVEEMKKEITISLEEFIEGKTGNVFLEVPPQQISETEWRGGGNLLLEVLVVKGDTYVVALRASGRIERNIKEAQELGIKLLHKSVVSDEFQTGPALKKKIQEEFDLDDASAYKYVGKMKGLWHIINRGIEHAKERQLRKDKVLQKLDEMKSRITISPEDFFGLQSPKPKEGIAFLEFNGAFSLNGSNYHHLSFLVERSEKEGKTVLTVLDATEFYTEGLLKDFVSQSYEDGEDFQRCPSVLGRILRAVRGQVNKALQLAD